MRSDGDVALRLEHGRGRAPSRPVFCAGLCNGSRPHFRGNAGNKARAANRGYLRPVSSRAFSRCANERVGAHIRKR
jgi:hypothetical protein